MSAQRLPEVVTAAYERSHQQAPRGRGGWLFQASISPYAFDADLRGEMRCFPGTYTQARQQARRAFAGEEFVAVLP